MHAQHKTAHSIGRSQWVKTWPCQGEVWVGCWTYSMHWKYSCKATPRVLKALSAKVAGITQSQTHVYAYDTFLFWYVHMQYTCFFLFHASILHTFYRRHTLKQPTTETLLDGERPSPYVKLLVKLLVRKTFIEHIRPSKNYFPWVKRWNLGGLGQHYLFFLEKPLYSFEGILWWDALFALKLFCFLSCHEHEK